MRRWIPALQRTLWPRWSEISWLPPIHRYSLGMSIQTQLCTFKTPDNERLHGLLFTPPESASDLALVLVHGVAMNFYLPPLSIFGQELAQRGYHSLVMNTRGHDWISRAGNLTKFGGSAYEVLEDCLPDLDGALEFLKKQSYRRFILIGHSLGAIKSIIYQGRRQLPEVIGIVSCSAPRQFYSERAARQPGFKDVIERAEALIAAGKPRRSPRYGGCKNDWRRRRACKNCSARRRQRFPARIRKRTWARRYQR